MDASLSLISATIAILEGRLALIHIPLELYPFFLQPVLRLLFGDDHDEDASKIPWTDRHKFLNVSITPIECSIVCSRDLAERFFRPLAELFNRRAGSEKEKIMISKEDFMVIQVDGQGLDAGQRVLELTRPLAMAGVSIFFKTTYFSDYILVPAKSRSAVTLALEQRGFTFSVDVSAFMHQSQLSPPPSSHRNHGHSPTSSIEGSFHSHRTSPTHMSPPSTPPASTVHELQDRTFARLKANNIAPSVDHSIRLISCAGRKEETPANISKLKDDLLQCLISTCPTSSKPSDEAEDDLTPNNSTRFLSLTLTDTDPISLFIESRFVSAEGASEEGDEPSSFNTLTHLPSSLLGSRTPEDILIPVILDLRTLPLEATGIVCGVAATLSHDTEKAAERAGLEKSAVEISFLSTAKTGTVLVRESDIDRAMGALERGFEGRDEEE